MDRRSDIQYVAKLEGGRPETGAMQFGDDWPGVFIRGDNAVHFAMHLQSAIADLPDSKWIEKSVLTGLANTLASSRVP